MTRDYILLETIPFLYYPRTEEVIPISGPVSRLVQFQAMSPGVGVVMTNELEEVTLSHYTYSMKYFVCLNHVPRTRCPSHVVSPRVLWVIERIHYFDNMFCQSLNICLFIWLTLLFVDFLKNILNPVVLVKV